jgi:hypothetical protein
MADGLRDGWQFDDRNDNTDVIRATLPIKLLSSSRGARPAPSSDVLVKSNLKTGNYDVYRPSRIVGQSDELIYSVNASTNQRFNENPSLFNDRFDLNTPEGRRQYESLNTTIKVATYNNAQLLTGTNPERNQNFQNIGNTKAYQSIANKTPEGQRSPEPNIQGATGDTGSPAQNPDREGGDNKFSVENRESLNNAIESSKTTRTDYGRLKYPSNLNTDINEKQDVVQFTMKSYGTRSLGENLRFSQRNFNTGQSIINGSVTMSIQPRISDSNGVNWSGMGMDALSMALVGTSLGIIEEGFTKGTANTIQQLQSLSASERNNLETAIKIKLAESAASTQNVLSRLTGGIFNPNLELLFESPSLRTFNYAFELSPRNRTESDEVKNIIRFFKQGMAVQRSVSELFLKAPNVFDIKYLFAGGSQEHPYINKIKGPCALTNCSVDYTPTGSYMTFNENEGRTPGSMVSYSLSLTFEELEPIYEDDYKDGYNSIGY